jgi:RNA polymerase sigma-70 factor (ECF subfamily)
VADPDRAAENARDAELAAKWKAGDKHAGDRLVQLHFSGVRLYFLSRAPLEHEDLVQETFQRLAAAIGRYREEAPFRAYLFIIARNVLCGHLRARYKWEGTTLNSSLAGITCVQMSSLFAAREALRLLLDALRRLPLDDQDMLELYHWQDLTAPELGALFELPVGTVRGRLRAATTRLKQAFAELSAGQHDRDIDEDDIERWLVELRAEIPRRRA